MTTNVDNTYERLVISGTGPYPFSFRIFDEDELTVTALESGEVDPVLLTITTHYTVTGENDEDGGSITLTALAVSLYSGFTLDIRSNTVVDQPTSIKNQGSFAPAVHEKAFDRLSRQVQDLARKVRSAFRYPDNTDLDAVMTARQSWLERYLYVNASGIIEPAIALANTLTQSIFNAFLALSDPYKRTAAEIAAGVTPTDYSIPSHLGLGYINPERYGLLQTATSAENIVAMEKAKDVSVQARQVIRVPGGSFPWTDWICDSSNVVIDGGGRNNTIWMCDDVSTNGIAFLFDVGSSTSIVRGGIRNCGFYKSDTNTKTAVKFVDQRQCVFDHIGINFGNWPGDGAIGLHTSGRDLFEIHHFDIECARPWIIDVNPNLAGIAEISMDITKVYMAQFYTPLATGKCVEVMDGTLVYHLEFDAVDFAGGKYGIYRNDTTSAANSVYLGLTGSRFEQAETDPTGYDIYWASTVQTTQNIVLRGTGLSVERSGIYIRKGLLITFDNVIYSIPGGEAVNITFDTNTHLSVKNCFWQTGSTVTLTNARVLWGLPNYPTMPMHSTGEYGPATATAVTATSEVALQGISVTIAQDATATIGTTSLLGTLHIATSENVHAVFELNGTNATTNEVRDSSTVFSNTADTASSYNIYATGGNYVIQNKRTGSKIVKWYLIGSLGVS